MTTNFCPDDVLHLIRSLDHKLEKSLNARLESFGLSSVQGRVLLFIYRQSCVNKDVTQKDLAEFFSLSKSTTSELIARMKTKELIEIDKTNGKSCLNLTEKAKTLVQKVHVGRKETVNKLEANLSDEDLTNLRNYLKILNKNMKGEKQHVEKDKTNS